MGLLEGEGFADICKVEVRSKAIMVVQLDTNAASHRHVLSLAEYLGRDLSGKKADDASSTRTPASSAESWEVQTNWSDEEGENTYQPFTLSLINLLPQSCPSQGSPQHAAGCDKLHPD